MALKVSEDLVEHFWLADENKCDIVICVIENADVGPPAKKRLCVVSAGGESATRCNTAATRVLQQDRIIKLHTVAERLLRSDYFKAYLKESWCKDGTDGTEGSSSLELPLETTLASPQAYHQCIKILCSLEPCCASMFQQPLEALEIYLASDHLLFEECSAACMDYLAAAPWSNDERKVISETFSTSALKRSEDLTARLGLPKEKVAKNLSQVLWRMYEAIFKQHESEEYELCPGGPQRIIQFQELMNNILRRKDPKNSCKKTIVDFLYKVVDDCEKRLKISQKERGDVWILDVHFLGWLHMVQLLMDTTDGKKEVEALACDEDFHRLVFPTFADILEEYLEYKYYYANGEHPCETVCCENGIYAIMLPECAGLISKALKLVAEGFRKIAEMEIIVPLSTRKSLVTRWVPFLEAFHEICDTVDMPTLKVHINKVLQTLSMNDETLLLNLAASAMKKDYFVEGAFIEWCDRFD